MAMLRNLRGMFSEIKDLAVAKAVAESLKAGVEKGKQFPFRYYSAYKALIADNAVNHKQFLLDTLEECMDISVANMPKLQGKTMCLSDNSGSAWGAITSEYGSTHVAEIANLSSLITAKQSDEGEVGLFGDRLLVLPVSKRNGLLAQLKDANAQEKTHGKIGGGTENGVWIFFKKAIAEKAHYDNIFIYSDQQAGHGGLYGTNPHEYRQFAWKSSSSHIDVLALITEYRKQVNPKVNVFSIQVAGYNNMVFPEDIYRGALLAGWTGKEPVYAKAIIDTWDQIEEIKPKATKKRTRKVTLSQ
jgi:hypothetical protein